MNYIPSMHPSILHAYAYAYCILHNIWFKVKKEHPFSQCDTNGKPRATCLVALISCRLDMVGPNGSAEWIWMANQFSGPRSEPNTGCAASRAEGGKSDVPGEVQTSSTSKGKLLWHLMNSQIPSAGLRKSSGDCTKNTPCMDRRLCRHLDSTSKLSKPLRSWTHVQPKTRCMAQKSKRIRLMAASWRSRKCVFLNSNLYIILKSQEPSTKWFLYAPMISFFTY